MKRMYWIRIKTGYTVDNRDVVIDKMFAKMYKMEYTKWIYKKIRESIIDFQNAYYKTDRFKTIKSVEQSPNEEG